MPSYTVSSDFHRFETETLKAILKKAEELGFPKKILWQPRVCGSCCGIYQDYISIDQRATEIPTTRLKEWFEELTKWIEDQGFDVSIDKALMRINSNPNK